MICEAQFCECGEQARSSRQAAPLVARQSRRLGQPHVDDTIGKRIVAHVLRGLLKPTPIPYQQQCGVSRLAHPPLYSFETGLRRKQMIPDFKKTTCPHRVRGTCYIRLLAEGTLNTKLDPSDGGLVGRNEGGHQSIIVRLSTKIFGRDEAL
ncbi:MAG: hypothetical protein PHS50_14625, partial [Kiritimatiellae bacterium]|nr:hypothetical protein [Kiritimatiellia bacterium]